MSNIKYILNEQVTSERYDDGGMFTLPGAENIVCLGKYEYEILDIILKYNLGDALRILLDTYEGDAIENNVIEFCEKLCELGIIKAQET